MFMKKSCFTLFFIFLSFYCFTQQNNLLPIENWTEGTALPSGFNRYGGPNASNSIKIDQSPHNENVLVWESLSVSQIANGGLRGNVTLDGTKSYRYTIWVKQKNDLSCGKTYFGTKNHGSSTGLHSVERLDGFPDRNPYFWHGRLPEVDKWYLLVGYVYHVGFDEAQVSESGVYDGETGIKVATGRDFRQIASPPSTNIFLRSFFYECNDTPGIPHQFWAPRVEELNGNEPTIGALLGLSGGGGSGSWSQNGDNITFDDGVVGVNMSTTPFDPDYKLMVNGDIKTKRIKVSPDGWADYVFEEDYRLPDLKSVSAFISKNKHLPDVPSEKEVLEKGVYLDEMDAILLKKIEELTLYLIDQDKEIEQLKSENEKLLKMITSKDDSKE